MDEYNSLSEEDKKSYDVSKLGEGVELVGYDNEDGKADLTKAFTKSSYKFDGIDDYIKIKYDGSKDIEIKDETGAMVNTQKEKEFLGENGFTFEFYGKMSKGRSVTESNNSEIFGETYMGILELGKELRIGLRWANVEQNIVKELFWNAGLCRKLYGKM